MPDLDLVFATPITLGPNDPIRLEEVEEMHTRSKLTQDFLAGRHSAADFLDYLNDDYRIDTGEFLDSVESNLNYMVDIYGRPLF